MLKRFFAFLLAAATAAGVLAAFFFVGAGLSGRAEVREAVRSPEARDGHAASPPVRAAFFMEREFYDEAYGEVPSGCPTGATGAIVNHHLLAKSFIADAISCLSASTKTVVLLGPNHFAVGSGPILASGAVWKTPYGDLTPDVGLLAALSVRGPVKTDEEPFAKEHGIGNLVAFIRRSLPQAKIVPMIFKDAATDREIDALAAALADALPKDAAVIASLDFSHELTPAAARHDDAKSLAVIESGDLGRLHPTDVDSEPTLRLMLALMKARGTARFSLRQRSNSAELLGRDLDDATSYLTGLFVPGEPERPKGMTFLALGDVMTDRGVAVAIGRHGLPWLLEPVRRLLRGSDATIANFEGTVSVRKDNATVDLYGMRFVSDATVLPKLRAAGFTHFSLANNHSRDSGHPGETTSLLAANGLTPFGEGAAATSDSAIIGRGGMRIALVGYDDFGGRGQSVAIKEIKRLRAESDAVVVMAHWGIEYSQSPSSRQRELAHAFVDAGADVVLGSHPHVIQPIEIYRDRAIFYSLGNFLFDQVPPETHESLAVGVRITPEEVGFSLLPLQSKAIRVSLSPRDGRAIILEKLGYPSGEFTLPRL